MTRILIVDDHALLRRGLCSILNGAFPDLQVTEAGDAQQAAAAAKKDAFELALVDINLPGRGGLELLQDFREQYPRMPVIVVSAFPERDYALRAFKLGAAGYVSKQSAESELLWAARKALTGGRYVTPSLA